MRGNLNRRSRREDITDECIEYDGKAYYPRDMKSIRRYPNRRKPFRVVLDHNGRRYAFGYYATPEEAIRVRDTALEMALAGELEA